VFQETPIYTRLVTERGDVPAQVRSEAQRIHRDLARMIAPGPPPAVGNAQYRPRQQ
jgi:hypothetical protein